MLDHVYPVGIAKGSLSHCCPTDEDAAAADDDDEFRCCCCCCCLLADWLPFRLSHVDPVTDENDDEADDDDRNEV